MIDWSELSCIVIGKGNKERKVYFDPITAMHIKQYLNTRKDVVDALFMSKTGKPLTIGGIQQAVKRIGNRAGVVKTHCHRFCISCCTLIQNTKFFSKYRILFKIVNIEKSEKNPHNHWILRKFSNYAEWIKSV